jgi:hypothetical protein
MHGQAQRTTRAPGLDTLQCTRSRPLVVSVRGISIRLSCSDSLRLNCSCDVHGLSLRACLSSLFSLFQVYRFHADGSGEVVAESKTAAFPVRETTTRMDVTLIVQMEQGCRE